MNSPSFAQLLKLYGSQNGAGASTSGMNLGNSGAYTPTPVSGSAPPVQPQAGAPYQPLFGPRRGF